MTNRMYSLRLKYGFTTSLVIRFDIASVSMPSRP